MLRNIVLCVCAICVCAALCFPARAASESDCTTRRGISLTADEERLLSAVVDEVAARAGGLPYAGRVALCAVVLRRFGSGRCGSTLAHVIAGTGLLSYCGAAHLYTRIPDAASVQAVRDAASGADPTDGAWQILLPSDTSHPARPGTVRFSCGGILFCGGA